ncbi:MAG: exo-alpha-sialidase [Chloroflexi bacterium]|nr:MAG: exo-alpha-sialidase [Chloroflexota bacterium]
MTANRKPRTFTLRRACLGAVAVMGALFVPLAGSPLSAYAAGSPDPVVLSDTSPGPITWTSDSFPGGANVTNTNGDNCFDSTGHPNPYTPTGPNACEVFTLTVNLSSATFWSTHSGGVSFHSDEGANDFDFYVYLKNSDGTKGALVTSQGAVGGTGGVENFTIDKAQGDYYVAAAAFATVTFTTGTFTFFLGPSIPNTPPVVTNPPGFASARASHDIFTSHSEPHVVMNPLNHSNLVAGSKMYVNNKHYLFRIGMYSSFDGGQTWSDAGHLPVPTCPATSLCSPPPDTTPSACAGDGPFSSACLFTTSDIWLTFDDEGNAYGIVLVSPSSNVGTGWEMWMYKSTDGGRTWPLSNMRVIHNHNDHNLSNFFLDDKDAIALDNYTLAGTGLTTGTNRPRDGHIGNVYACWGLDGTVVPTQNQVFSRSLDGGNTWSQAVIISGATNAREIGCQIAVAPSGRVYVSFFVYALTSPAEAPYVTGIGQYLTWSDDHGVTFTTPIKVAAVNPLPNHLQAADNFRNLSLPAMAVSPADSSVYVTWADEHTNASGQDADILIVKGTPVAGVPVFGSPVRVNQDPVGNGKDQFQPQIAITASGQVNVSYFDRRNDPNDFFIDTYLSRSNNGGATWADTRVTQAMSDPRINPPIDGAGNYFYGDYQGLVADDTCAIPFWNDTHLANLATTDPNYSQWQEVFSARIPNGKKCK